MSTERETKLAQNVYNTICEMLDEKGINYTKHEDDLVISCTVRGYDIPMDVLFFVNADRQVVRLLSPMPFEIPEDKRFDVGIAVNVANYGLLSGSFDYDISDGELRFRMTTGYRESILGKDLFEQMIMVSALTTDEYNDKFMMLAKGVMSLEQFIEAEKKE